MPPILYSATPTKHRDQTPLPQKLHALFTDHQLHKEGVPLPQRPLQQLKKNALLFPLLKATLAATLTTTLATQPLSATPSNSPSNHQKAPETTLHETQKFLMEQNQKEIRSLSQKNDEENRYAARLENYKINPPSLGEILTDVWEDLGLPREEAKQFVQNSFQNETHTKTDLNKKATLLYAETDILHADTLTGLKNFFKCGVHSNILATTTKLLNTQHNANIPPPPNSNPQPEQLAKTWKHIEELAQKNPDALNTLALVKSLADEMVEKMLGKAAGWAAAGDHVYIVSKNYDAKTLFQFISTHEATHTAQSLPIPTTLADPLLKLKKDLVAAFCEKIDQKQAIAQQTGLALSPQEARTKKESFAEEIDYLTEPKEIPTWAGMIKKIYFEQTGKLIQKSSTEKDLLQFDEWLQKENPEENEYKSHVIKTFRLMKKILSASPETEKILSEHLLDVAEKKPFPKKGKENPPDIGIC